MFFDGLFCNVLTRVTAKNDGSQIFELGPKYFFICTCMQKCTILVHFCMNVHAEKMYDLIQKRAMTVLAHDPPEHSAKEPIQKYLIIRKE